MMSQITRLSRLLFIAILTIVTLLGCEAGIELPVSKEEASQLAALQTKEVELIAKEQPQENNEVETDQSEQAAETSTTEADPSLTAENGEQGLAESKKDQPPSDQAKPTKERTQQKETNDVATTKENNVVAKDNKASNEKKNTNTTQSETTTVNQKSPAAKQESSHENNQDEPTLQDTIVISVVISESEVPLPPTVMEIEEGDTVLEALIKITKEKGIQMDYRGGRGATAYIEGIANVYEFDRGQGSGWMYRVNGVFPDRGAGVIPLLSGDRVEWLYTTDLGVDLGADLEPFRR